MSAQISTEEAQKLASNMHQFVTTSILAACPDQADIIHDQADEGCPDCAWNSIISDEDSITKHREQQIAVDDWKVLDETYQCCPWCGSNLES